MNDYINIGKLVAVSGLKGEMVLKHALGKKTDFKDAECIFIEQVKHSYLPYFIESAKSKNTEETLVKLESVNTPESAKVLIKKQVWITIKNFEKLAAKSSPIKLIGYTAENDGAEIGLIEEVIEQPHQILLKVTIENKEVLLPLHEATLIKIDHKNNKVKMNLPEGLLDIYLK